MNTKVQWEFTNNKTKTNIAYTNKETTCRGGTSSSRYNRLIRINLKY